MSDVADHTQSFSAIFDYHDAEGNLLHQLCYAGAETSPALRSQGPDGEWVYNPTVRSVPYRLPDLVEAIALDHPVFLTPNESGADALTQVGAPASAMGGFLSFTYGLSDEERRLFAGGSFLLLPSNKPASYEFAVMVAENLASIGAYTNILELDGLAEGEDIRHWLNYGGTVADLHQMDQAHVDMVPDLYDHAKQQQQKDKPWVSRYGGVRLSDIDSFPTAEFEYIIQGLFSRHDISVIGGAKSSGKSFLAIHASMAVIRGGAFFGHNVKRKGAVLYQAGEGARGIKKRLRAYRKKFGASPDDANFVLLTKSIDLYSANGDTAPLIAEIKGWQAQLPVPVEMVFIDTVATATPGADENSGKDMGIVLANVAKIRTECGVHVALVHHLNASGTKLRGHTSIAANLDQVIEVVRDEKTKIRTATLQKQKDDEDGVSFKFELERVVLKLDEDGSEITSCVVVPVGGKENAKPGFINLGFRLNESETVFFRALLEALRLHGRLAPSDIALRGNALQVVEYAAFRKLYEETNPWLGGESIDDAKRSAKINERIKRAGGNLSGANVIGVGKHDIGDGLKVYVWWTGRAVRDFKETQPPHVEAPRSVVPDDLNEADL